MCPDRKIDWFKENDFTTYEIRHLKTSVIAHWVQKYGSDIIASEEVDAKKVKVRVLQFCQNYV
jgi:hypothetical protein